MRRALIAVVLMVIATGAGIAAASTIMAGPAAFERAPEHLLPGPAELMVGARSPGAGGEPGWAVRTYVSRTGLLCVERGRLQADLFGDLDEQGRLEPRPAGPTGICGDAGRDAVVAGVEQLPAHGEDVAHTVVLGASLRRPTSAVVTPAGGAPVDLPLGARGSFIGVFAGLRPAEDLVLTVTLAGGDQVRFDWRGEPTRSDGP